MNRITSAATLPACTANCWNLAFTLDEWANLTAVAGKENATLTPNASNRIGVAPFTYDASGNELTDVTSSYTWNAESEMKAGGGVTYLYDGRGNRVEKSGTKLYWYGPNGQVFDETDTTGSTTNTAFSEYVYFDGARVARRDYQNNQYYYFEDQVNSSRVIAEVPAGTRTATLCYDADFYPFGGEIDFTDTCAQNYKFQGKERDPETGNDYFGARFYSSAYGRFLSPDWSSIPAPVPYANIANPQTLNLYAFVSDNPESFADLDGHMRYPGEPPDPGDPGNPQTCQQQKDGSCAPPAQPQSGASQGQDQQQSISVRIFDFLVNNALHCGGDNVCTGGLPGPLGAEAAAVEITSAAVEVTGAAARAGELANALGKTKDFVTVAVTETKEGVSVISSSENALRPAVKAMLGDSEVAAKGAGHAEVTGVNAAKQLGLTPTGVAASRPICASCAAFLRNVGVAALSLFK